MTPPPGPDPTPLIQFDRVSFAYDQAPGSGPGFHLRDVSLTLHAGELIAIIGQNGSGKTTLGRLGNGLLAPTSGRVLVQGEATRGKSVADLAPQVGYVFQNPDHQLFAPTVTADVGFGPRNLGLSPAEIEARVQAALGSLGLTALADHHPLLLSYGERRLVALAGVLALGSPALILDEPTAGLDHAHRDLVLDVIHQRQRDGAGVILITHDFDLVAAHADRVVVMARGDIVGDGPPRAVLTDAALLAAADLAPARITRLAQRLARLGIAADVLTVPEFAHDYEAVYRRAHPLPGQEPD